MIVKLVPNILYSPTLSSPHEWAFIILNWTLCEVEPYNYIVTVFHFLFFSFLLFSFWVQNYISSNIMKNKRLVLCHILALPSKFSWKPKIWTKWNSST